MSPLPKKNFEDKSNDNKNINLKNLCDKIENNQDTSTIIFHFSESWGNIMDYKWAIIWVPYIIYIIIIIYNILNISDVNLINQSNSFISEIYLGIISFFIMFIVYGLIDFLYQFSICKQYNITTYKILKNCIYNSFYISLSVFFGYILGINFVNKTITNKDAYIISNSWKRNISNNYNNLIVATFFYFIALLYKNPITFNNKKISRNIMC